MKKLLVMTAAAGLLVVASIEEASARYRGAAVVASVVALAVFALSASAAVIEVRLFGLVLSAIVAHRVGYVGGARYVGRRVGGYYPYRYGYRRYAPYAVGLGVAAATAYSYNNCYRYNGWQWVNVCYEPYSYDITSKC